MIPWLSALILLAPPDLKCQWAFPIDGTFAGAYRTDASLARVDTGGAELGARARVEVRCPRRFDARLTAHTESRAGSRLDQTRVAADLALGGRVARRLRLGVTLGLDRVWRDRWPDPYQPVLDAAGRATGAVATTDRRGLLDADVSLRLDAWVRKRLSVHAEVGWERRVGDRDADYDALLRPDHLVPSDRDTVAARLAVRGRRRGWAWRAEGAGGWRRAPFQLARDAGTGATHGALGGAAPNPLYEAAWGSVAASGSRWFGAARTRVTLAGELDANVDLFEGYDTWMELGARVSTRTRLPKRVVLEAAARVAWRSWTEDGYAAAAGWTPEAPAGHPPLDGDAGLSDAVRQRVEASFSLELSRRLVGALTPFVAARLTVVETNFPDYVPGVFPSTAQIALDFDALELIVVGGLRFAL